MPLREFTDSFGRDWKVWATTPESTNRIPIGVRERYQDGWLAFETLGEMRRLAPIPADWEGASAEALEELCARAELRPPRRRLVE